MRQSSFNNAISTTMSGQFHRTLPRTPYKMIIDDQASLLAFMTRNEFQEYLETRF